MVLSFSYGPHQFLGKMMPRMSRRSMRALELKKKMAPDTPPPVENKEKWPHAYQRIKETKEYHALEDFYWFYEEWNLINNRFVKKFGKRLQDMLIELQYMHRVKLENKVIMDNVKRMEDVILPVDVNVTIYPELANSPGSLICAALVTIPKPGPRVEWKDIVVTSFNEIIPDWKLVERIGYADKKPRPHTFFEHADAHLKTRKEDWKTWEKYCASMAERLKNEEPHYPEFPYLKVFGDRVRARVPKDRSFVCKEEQKVYQPSPTIPKEQRPVYHDGPVGYLSPPWLHFACKPGAVTSHMVKLENVGSTVLFYRWERRPLESMGVTTPRRTFRTLFNKLTQALHHRELMRDIGDTLESIQERVLQLAHPTEEFRNAEYMFSPEAFNFIKQNLSVEPPIYFTPSVYIKFDAMVRVVRELLRQQQQQLVGVEKGSESGHLAAELDGDADAVSVVSGGTSASPLPSWARIEASKLRPPLDPLLTPSAASASEKALATLLGPGSVITGTVARSEAATEAPSSRTSVAADDWESEPPQTENLWDGAVMPILQCIAVIQDEGVREQLQQGFRDLLAIAQIPPHQTALLHFQMYRTLHNLADAVEEIFERVNEDESFRPAVERLLQSFYVNYLREGAEKEQQDLLEADSVKEFGSMKEKSDLVELWETELKREAEVASPAENQELLTYCFKWIQIMTELRCAMPEGFNFYQGAVEQEQAAVIDRMAQRIAEAYADDEINCWNIFSLERHKTELFREQRELYYPE